MSNSYFRFRQFTVYHDRCAMKVGTDGVLLGAWAILRLRSGTALRLHSGNASILDIGTGTGLIALMLAQRYPAATIDAIEIDEAACGQARENVSQSPFANRVDVIHTALQRFRPVKTYDLIVCNPPYFEKSLKNPDLQRSTARHDTDLSLEELFACTKNLLTDEGRFSLIIPAEKQEKVLLLSETTGLFLIRKTTVYPTPTGVAKRYLLEFSNQPQPLAEDTLIIELARHRYSPEYQELTNDFYL